LTNLKSRAPAQLSGSSAWVGVMVAKAANNDDAINNDTRHRALMRSSLDLPRHSANHSVSRLMQEENEAANGGRSNVSPGWAECKTSAARQNGGRVPTRPEEPSRKDAVRIKVQTKVERAPIALRCRKPASKRTCHDQKQNARRVRSTRSPTRTCANLC
jgi:hypothetical protein